jgi:hypothetical protein
MKESDEYGTITVTIRRYTNLVILVEEDCNYRISNSRDTDWETPRVSFEALELKTFLLYGPLSRHRQVWGPEVLGDGA